MCNSVVSRLLGAQAAQKRARLLLECNQIARGGGDRDHEAACWLRIQIPPGRSLKDKPHAEKENKNVTPRKCNRHQQPDTVREPAALLSAACHSSCWMKLQLRFALGGHGTVQILLSRCGPHHPQDTPGRPYMTGTVVLVSYHQPLLSHFFTSA